jgi:hypothetical protein
MHKYQSLVGSVVIDAEPGRKNHGSIPATMIRRGLKPLDARTDPEPDSIGGENQNGKCTSQIIFTIRF